MNWLKRLFSDAETSTTEAIEPARQLPARAETLSVKWREGSFPLKAVGESHYQAALARICGGHSRHGHEFECRALVVPEPTNAYDPNAMKVVINGSLVGYLPRDQAIRLKEQTAAVGRPSAALDVSALIKGGWKTNQHDVGDFGVQLGIPTRGAVTFAGFDPQT